MSSIKTSWVGIRAVELLVRGEMASVKVIVRLASEAAPTLSEVSNKVGLHTRNVLNKEEKIFTAMHYGTNDNLKTGIGALALSDVLSPETVYIAYMFYSIGGQAQTGQVRFTTLAVPPAGDDWTDNTDTSMPLRLTRSIPDDYTIASQVGETILLPVYYKVSYPVVSGMRSLRPGGAAKQTVSCTTSANGCTTFIIGYTALGTYRPIVGDDTYFFYVYGIQSVSRDVDVGRYTIRGGGVGSSNLTLTSDSE